MSSDRSGNSGQHRKLDGPVENLPPPREAVSLDTGLLSAKVESSKTLNLAMAHNAVPLVSAVRVTNRTNHQLDDILVRLELKPGASEPWEARLTSLGPGETYNLSRIDIPLRLERLVSIEEREPAQLWLELLAGGDPALHRAYEVDLLAHNEWNGLVSLPQLLAAFVQPNHPAVATVLGHVRTVIQRQTGDPSLSGYQRQDPSQVRAMVSALYTAIQELEISYVNPPASFEKTGQKIRTPDLVLQQSMGTCLDLTVLVAACLEQVGLHPWLVLVQGHAFPGVWLSEDQSPWAWTDDALQLLKVTELDGVLLFDATTMVARPRVSLERAEKEAQAYLTDADQFGCAICVKAARAERIRPLPARVEAGAYEVVPDVAPEHSRDTPGAAAPRAHVEVPSSEQEPPAPGSQRLARWKERLLDLTLRNRLLNFRETKKTIPLSCPDIPRFEDALALGRTFLIHPKPELLAGEDPRYRHLLDARTGEDTQAVFLEEQLQQGRLHSTLTPKELERRQLEIARAARLSLEESGVSTLFLALGFLSWRENSQSEQTRLAPLILLPVELSRKTARDPFRLARIDEEAQANITLLEKLRKEFGIEIPELADELPQDDAGVDMPLVLRLYREAVLSIPNWHVEDMAFLGHFSFTKFLMWRDLDAGANELLRSPVVQHLSGAGGEPFAGSDSFPRPERLDRDQHPKETFCPLDADSTQLSAVFAAEARRTFVLEGPPGTGKSQTIANLISQCLATGQTVLFVSEKMAALEVVHRRLEKVGLGEFCLELHSNKARKREVLERLGQSWDALAALAPADWDARAGKLEHVRRQLNTYVESMHRPRVSGETAFEVTSRLISLRDSPRVRLSFGEVDRMDGKRRDELQETVARLQAAALPLGDAACHPFRAAGITDWQPSAQDRVETMTARLCEATEELARRLPDCAKVLQADAYPMCAAELKEHRQMSQLLLSTPGPPEGLLAESDWSGNKARVEGWLQHGRQRDSLRCQLDHRYDTPGLLELDVQGLHQRFKQWSTAFFLFAFFMLFFARLKIRKVIKPGEQLPASAEVTSDLKAALELARENETLRQLDDQARQTLGTHWSRGEGELRWDALDALVKWVDQFRHSLGEFLARRDLDHVAPGQRKRLLLLSGEESPVGVQGSPARKALEAYVSAHDRFEAIKAELGKVLQLDEELAWGSSEAPAHLDGVARAVQSWIGGATSLRDWCHYSHVRQEARASSLGPLVRAHLAGEVSTDQLAGAFERGYGEWWLERVSTADPALAGFNSAEHQRRIQVFVDLDESLCRLSREVVRARLASRLPDPHAGVAAQSDLGVLLRELQKKTRHMPMRKLFSRIPSLLRLLKPCLLMSPLSVAQYLGTDYSPFDLVVFDEASQIPTHDAIGAIGRAKQAVVVGDTKQLPPTAFFMRLVEDTAPDESDIDELESILDECLAAGLPRLRLGWHYRSRHESLIAFSNYHYYDNSLHTFPSAENARECLGVSLHPVPDGHYDKGRSRTNKAEAAAVVGEVMRRLGDPTLRRRSLGIVTFSMAQQRLIEELLDEQRREHPEIEPFFGSGVLESLFIKNLENVQGDERDVMLFSVCYGPDKTGAVSMNFGPLNRTGGERRLNVAITRARYQLIVFSTLTADQIDLSRTRSEGARNLKTFLDYARRGPAAIAEATVPGEAGQHDSPFERMVCQGLQERGWELHAQVGCSGYRIDLGVVDPERPGRYLLGVECDGATYHSARCARDRDRLRELVLTGLGWRLHRIWSSDYWHDPKRELDKVEDALRHAQSIPPERDATGAWSEVQPETESASDKEQLPKKKAVFNPKSLFASAPKSVGPEHQAEPPGELYPNVPAPGFLGLVDNYYQQDQAVLDKALEVISREAPIHMQLLTRRVQASYDMKRVTQKTEGRLKRVLQNSQVRFKGDFVWAPGQDPNEYDAFRRPGDQPEQQRKAQEIAPEEAAVAALWVLRQNIALPVEDLVRETGRLFGFARTGKQIKSCIMDGLEVLVQRGKCRRKEGRVEYRK